MKASAVSKHLNFRDKSVKTLQYASRVLLGYYGETLESTTKSTLHTVVQNCSQGRKAFRLLKSVNMLQSLILPPSFSQDDALMSSLGNDDECHENVKKCREVAKQCESLELMCMVGYYACDNILFLGRAKILRNSYNAQFWESATFSFWAINDVIALFRGSVSLFTCQTEINRIENQALMAKEGERERGGEGLSDSHTTSTDRTPIADLEGCVTALLLHRKKIVRTLIKSLLDLGVSGGHCMNCYRHTGIVKALDKFTPFYHLFGKEANMNGNTGLCGLISALMTIQDILR